MEVEVRAIFNLADYAKAHLKFKKLCNDSHIDYMTIIRAVPLNNCAHALAMLREHSDDFKLLNAKELITLILLLSCLRQHNVIEYMLLAEYLLGANQFVGAFLLNYETALSEGHHMSTIIIEHILKNKKAMPNFGLVYERICEIAQSIYPQYYPALNELATAEHQITLVVDRPIIKVYSLTPRIKADFLPYSRRIAAPEEKADELKKLSKQANVMKKKLMKDIVSDQQAVFLHKKAKTEHHVARRKQELNKGLRIMEEQQMEIKKLKSMQLNIKKHKKKGTRKAGNKH